MDQPDGCPEVPFNSFFGISDVLNLRESCMRENRTCSCVSRQGWHVQQEANLRGQESEAL